MGSCEMIYIFWKKIPLLSISRILEWMSLCVCVCVREREKERDSFYDYSQAGLKFACKWKRKSDLNEKSLLDVQEE